MTARTPPPYATDDRLRATRGRAVRTMLVSGPIALGAATLATFGSGWLGDVGLDFLKGPWLLLAAATPWAPFLLALASWLSGRSRGALEASWNALAGWQRGLLGILVVLVAAAVIVGSVVLVLDRIGARG
jgi:hypothetical protein